jgi:hypothetical protein
VKRARRTGSLNETSGTMRLPRTFPPMVAMDNKEFCFGRLSTSNLSRMKVEYSGPPRDEINPTNPYT